MAHTKLKELTVEAAEYLFNSVIEFLDPPRKTKLRVFWAVMADQRSEVCVRARSREFQPFVARYLEAGATEAGAMLEKHEDEDSKGIKCLEKCPVHNMECESVFGAFAEAGRAKNAGVQRLRGRVLDMRHGHTSTTYQMQERIKTKFLALKKKGEATDDEWTKFMQKEQRQPTSPLSLLVASLALTLCFVLLLLRSVLL